MTATILALLLATGSPGYVTRHEYHRVEPGWTKHHTHQVFDTHGTAVQASRTRQTRVYPGWKAGVEVYVKYRTIDGRWRVTKKYVEASVVSP